MKRSEESVHVSSSAVEPVSRPLAGAIQPVRISPPPMANVILTGELRNTSNRLQVVSSAFTSVLILKVKLILIIYSCLQEPSIAASMATFSAASYVASANGSAASTTGPLGTSPPVPFAGSNQAKAPAGSGVAVQVAAQQQHIYHQSLAHQQVRHSLTTAAAPAGSPPISAQSTSQQAQQQNSMQQAFQVNFTTHLPISSKKCN